MNENLEKKFDQFYADWKAVHKQTGLGRLVRFLDHVLSIVGFPLFFLAVFVLLYEAVSSLL